MGIASLIIGILSVTGVCISLIPLLNLLNCITLPIALVGGILGFADLVRPKSPDQGRAAGIVGLILCALALLVGGIRFGVSLIAGGGIV